MPTDDELKYCVECGEQIRRRAVICPKCGIPQPAIPQVSRIGDGPPAPNSSRIAAGVLGILLGCFGVHKFVLGYTLEGVIMLLVTIIGSLVIIGPLVMAVIGIIEGITYLTKTDDEFEQIYVLNRRPWF